MNRLLGLELLRGVAALLVLQEHLRYAVRNICGPDAELPRLMTRVSGFWGVDIFFVLSGFLIGLTLERTGTTPRSFLLARLARVLPLYLLASACCLALPTFRLFEYSPQMLVTTLTLLPLSGDALDPQTAHPFGWTLCYEMLFYLAATAVAAAVPRRRVVLWLMATFTLGPLLFAAVGPVRGWDFPSFALSPVAAEFALGLATYRLVGRIGRRVACLALVLGTIGLAVGIARDVVVDCIPLLIAHPAHAAVRVTTWGLPAALLVLGMARLEAGGCQASKSGGRLASAAGAGSYSLYLIQPFGFTVAHALADAVGITTPWPAAILTVTVTLALAAAVSRYVDHPLHALARGWAKRLSAPAARAARVPGPVVSIPPLALR